MEPKKNNWSTTRKIVFAAIATAFAILIAYIYVSAKGIDVNLKKIGLYVAIASAAAATIWGAVWLITKHFGNKDDELPELPKEIVGSDRAIDVWKEMFTKKTGIPHGIRRGEKEDQETVVPTSPHHLTVVKEKMFVDPSGQTADRFILFQAISRAGNRQGVHSVIIRTDQGEAWIKKNWNGCIQDNTPTNTYDPQFDTYPITSSMDWDERLAMKTLELSDEGFTASEIKEVITPFTEKKNHPKPVPAARPKPIETPGFDNKMYEASDDEDDDEETLESDIERYRRRTN